MSPTFVRSNHWAAYRRYEWAEIIRTDQVNGRACWLLSWPDGATDVWVVDDPTAEYEFSEEEARP